MIKINEEDFILENIGLIRKLAYSYSKKTGVNQDDLFQEACIGMIDGLRKYEADKNTQVLTYCYYYMKKYMCKFVEQHANTVRIPSHIFFDKSKGDRRINVCSYDNKVNNTSGTTFKDIMIDEKNINVDDKLEVEEKLNKLSAPQKKIIFYRFFLGYTQKETGEILGITKQAVSVHEKKALNKMRKKLQRRC